MYELICSSECKVLTFGIELIWLLKYNNQHQLLKGLDGLCLKNTLRRKMEERLGDMRDEEKLGGRSCRFHGSSGEDVALFLQILILPCFFISFFFCIGNYIAFYIYKDFFYIVCVLYVLYL